MPWKSRWQLEVPDCSLTTLVFGSPAAEVDNTKPLYIDADSPDDHFLTKHAYRLLCQRFAAGLRKLGLQEGDRVMLYSGNNIYFPCVIMGTIMASGIFTGANPAFVAREVAYQLKDSGAKFLLCTSASLAVGLEAAAEVDFPKDHVYYFDNSARGGPAQSGVRHWTEILVSEEEGCRFEWDPMDKPGENGKTVALNYSSGTTGRPKGVEITHRNYVANSLVQEMSLTLRPDAEETKNDSRNLCFLPMYHAMAQTIFGATNAMVETPTYIMQKFDFITMMDYLEKYRITSLALVPPILVMMAKHPDVKKGRWDLSSIRAATAGAAPLGRPACEEFEALWAKGVLNVHQGWGMTEGTCSLSMTDPTSTTTEAHVGELAPGSEGKLVKEDGSGEAGIGERGELWVRGPTIMKGYWHNEKATRETLTPDGFLMTGDIAYRNKAGEMFIVDRKKELIKVKGNQVAPAELEALLLEHPAVTDAAVIGVPYNGDEAPRAYIVRTAGKDLSAKAIADFLASKVTRYKRLAGGVRFVDAIPKNPSGKILRRYLREQAAKEDQVSAKL